MSRTLTGWNFWGTRGSRGTEAPARQPGTRVNPLQRAGPIRVRAEIPSVTRKRAFLNHASSYVVEGLEAIPADGIVDRFCATVVSSKTGRRLTFVKLPGTGTGTTPTGSGVQIPLRNLAPARLITGFESTPGWRLSDCTKTAPREAREPALATIPARPVRSDA